MAKKRKMTPRGGIRKVNAPVRDLVDAITETVLERIAVRLPGKEDLKDIERNVKELTKRIDALSRRKGTRRVGRPRSNRKCEVAGCDLPHVAQGFCSRHYQAWRRKNDGKVTRTTGRKKKRGRKKRA